MKSLRVIIVLALAFLLLGSAGALAEAPEGFKFISEWGVYAREDDIFWHAGVQWKLQDGTWVKLQAGTWVLDLNPPAVIVNIPKDQAHCPPGLAKKGCAPPGLQKKGGGPPGAQKEKGRGN